MNAAAEPAADSASPSREARSLIERLIGFHTVSRDSNLGNRRTLVHCVQHALATAFGAEPCFPAAGIP